MKEIADKINISTAYVPSQLSIWRRKNSLKKPLMGKKWSAFIVFSLAAPSSTADRLWSFKSFITGGHTEGKTSQGALILHYIKLHSFSRTQCTPPANYEGLKQDQNKFSHPERENAFGCILDLIISCG